MRLAAARVFARTGCVKQVFFQVPYYLGKNLDENHYTGSPCMPAVIAATVSTVCCTGVCQLQWGLPHVTLFAVAACYPALVF